MQQGYAPRYNPGVMERVVERRGLPTKGYYVSSPYYDIGTRVLVCGLNTSVCLPATIGDVSAPKDKERHIRTKRIAELQYEMALPICGNMGRPIDCPILIIRLEEP